MLNFLIGVGAVIGCTFKLLGSSVQPKPTNDASLSGCVPALENNNRVLAGAERSRWINCSFD